MSRVSGYSPKTKPNWSEVSSKPSTFAPSAHSHAWPDIANKPSTFTPSAHNHAISDITGLSAALAAKKGLTSLAALTVGETLVLGLSLGVKRYSVTVPGAAVGDRLYVALTGSPQNGTLQDAYVSTANTVSIGLLIPAVGLGTVIAVPVEIFKIT